MIRYLLLFDSYGLVFMGRLLWRVYAAGPCQRSLPRVGIPWDSRPYFTVSDLRLPVSSPPTTRRVTVEVFDPASTRVFVILAPHGQHRKQSYCCLAQTTQRTSHVIAISPVHWLPDCCLATGYKHSSRCCVPVSWIVYQAVARQCVDI
jgi:hypothetical protein